MSDAGGGGAVKALSARERPQGGVDKMRMIDRVRLGSRKDIKTPPNLPHRTEEADAATHEQHLMFQRPCGSTQSSFPS